MWPDTITEDVVIQAFCNGDVAMTGEIDSKLDVGRSAALYEVLPDKVYKGRVTIPVFAISETGGRCGYPFVAGKRYLIYASIKAESRYLSASICGLTGQAEYKSFDLTVLDRVASQSSVLARRKHRRSDGDRFFLTVIKSRDRRRLHQRSESRC
jgi:hypothetical protein